MDKQVFSCKTFCNVQYRPFLSVIYTYLIAIYPLLDDKAYAFTSEKRLYDFFEVTDIVR